MENEVYFKQNKNKIERIIFMKIVFGQIKLVLDSKFYVSSVNVVKDTTITRN